MPRLKKIIITFPSPKLWFFRSFKSIKGSSTVSSVVIKITRATSEMAPQRSIYGACQPAEFVDVLPSDNV
jgi:hypothetical protein